MNEGNIEAPVTHSPRPVTTSSRAHVVVVDDDPTILDILGRYLTHAGFDVTTCETTQEVEAVLEMASIDVLITDLSMPEDGAILIQRTKANHPDLPIIVVTGRPITDQDQPIIDMYVEEIFEKPTRLSDLARTVGQLSTASQSRYRV